MNIRVKEQELRAFVQKKMLRTTCIKFPIFFNKLTSGIRLNNIIGNF